MAAVGFTARRHDFALAGAAPVEFVLDVFFTQLEARRTAIDDDTYAAAVGFPPSRNSKELAKAAAHLTATFTLVRME